MHNARYNLGIHKALSPMEFYNKIHCKYTGIKGFLTVYHDALKYAYMTTEKAKEKARILVFWEKHGLEGVKVSGTVIKIRRQGIKFLYCLIRANR